MDADCLGSAVARQVVLELAQVTEVAPKAPLFLAMLVAGQRANQFSVNYPYQL